MVGQVGTAAAVGTGRGGGPGSRWQPCSGSASLRAGCWRLA